MPLVAAKALYIRDGRRFLRASEAQVRSAAASLRGNKGGRPPQWISCIYCRAVVTAREFRAHWCDRAEGIE